MEHHEFRVPNTAAGQRLDLAIVAFRSEWSRRKVRSIIDCGGVYLNRRRVRIASRALTPGDLVEIEFSEQVLKRAKSDDLTLGDRDILLDEGQILAINKPAGMAAQATRLQAKSHLIAATKKKLDYQGPLFPVHRLDLETSGLTLVARSAKRAEFLSRQFQERMVKKTYLALCVGIPKEPSFSIRCRLAPLNPRTGLVEESPRGKLSETDFRVIQSWEEQDVSLVACHPKTGRTHQIRIHLQLAGHPILGDKRYSVAADGRWRERHLRVERQMLHARALKISLNAGSTPREIQAPLPPDFQSALNLLGS